MPRTAKAYITLVIASGTTLLLLAAGAWSSASLRQFAIYLGLAALASTLKIRIPGMEATVSPNFVFLLLGIATCSFSELVAISLTAALVQSLWSSAARPRLIQVAFSCATLILSSAVAFEFPRLLLPASKTESSVALIILAGSLYFPLNSALVFSVISLVDGEPWKHVATKCYQRVFPYFMGGIAFAGMISGAYAGSMAWKGALLLLPAVVLAHLYFVNRANRDAARIALASGEEVGATDIVY